MKIAILATGGTISGFNSSPLGLGNYEVGVYTIEQMIEQIPEINNAADLTLEQLGNFNSSDMKVPHWLLLKEKIEFYLNKKNFDGVVITHGTNTIEETAYFLHLTINSNKPVVLVGSQRPFSALSTDAGINLINAVRVASSTESKNKGVLVVLNNQINCAREATKTSTFFLEAFQSGQLGYLGYVDVDGTVQYYRAPTKKHTVNSMFSTVDIKNLPKVGIAYSHAGVSGDIIQFMIESGKYKGIVIAGTGAGMVSEEEEKALGMAKDNEVVIVRSSRVGNGRVIPMEKYQEYNFINADNLIPQKARILLMLSLATTKEINRIQEYFNQY